ncbi:response regulator transcription factor [Devosia sp.]|uniref:response regulator transcription factor n=1 Tax=Devosia sp. TaxID=1871048 RepID=UPI002AFDE95C|nr:response regulator transcription factor [Devosia sp.]
MSQPPASPRLCLLIEDQPSTRDWMLSVLHTAFPDLAVETAATLKAAHAWLDRKADDLWLAIVDIGLPDGSGVDIVRRLSRDHPDALPVVATIYDDDAHLFDAIAAGARGYVLKDEEAGLLVNYLRRIERGEPPLSPSIAHRMLAHFRAPARQRDEAGLSPRETEVLTLLARGLTVAEAAARLGLQPQTVASYVKVIYQKLCITSRAEATREAVKRGLA